ncbi:MAG: long-chain-acyl-CoA synthetase [Rhodobiaceae bacterium]|nr:long-chain-acyl-CoA synthetase [Rhodobiaceae bacterium]MCC0056881.1 long-chain-acyl-CoA synthetase [Rhodobiaceae bacterium]
MNLLKRLKSEWVYLYGAIRILRSLRPVMQNRTRTFPDLLDELALKHGPRIALLSQNEQLTYKQLGEHAHAYSHWAKAQGVGKGDTVALLMNNRPEYLAIWMGVIRTGAVTALLNTHLSGAALAYCINIVNAKHIIVGADLWESLESALPSVTTGATIWIDGASRAGYERFDRVVSEYPTTPLAKSELPALTIEDPALYIYTSGTTGMPKAAIINHYRVQAVMKGFSATCNARRDDRIYVAQPLYHTAGGVLAPGITLTVGGSVFIRDRFSARQFWDDVVDYECTMFQYIGELCRYLLNSPTHPKETQHKIRLCDGNGLRPDIWMEFKNRFRIPQIIEWYAATEGNVTMFNLDGTPGSVGRIPWWLEHRFMTKIIKFDIEAEAPIRDAEGHCIECAPNEVGEAIGKIVIDPGKPAQRFDGYADKSASESKILRGAFEEGDAWFRTGDLLRKDALGYFFFVDRIGDTYRWKGENVSTHEVAESITIYPGVLEATVYGVKVPGMEGAAGMAMIVPDDEMDLDGLAAHIRRQLPEYARPLFLRLSRQIEATGTFKQRKVEMRKQGFDPSYSSDPLYFANPTTGRFEPLDTALYARICSGEFRL